MLIIGQKLTDIQGIIIEIEKKNIKNLYLKVLPPEGRVLVSAPKRMSDKRIYDFIASKAGWIKKQQMRFENQPVQPERKYVSGETVYVWGKKCRLYVVETAGRNKVEQENGGITLYIRKGMSAEQKEKLLNEWYRGKIKQEIPVLIAKWEPVMKVKVQAWGVKNMKTRWGTCNVKAERIWLNLQLAKREPDCLEYVVVHEMTHLLEKSHNPKFWGLMDVFYPDWRNVRAKLSRNIDG